VDLQLTEEQTMLREAVGELLAGSAADAGLWQELVAFGALDVGDGLGAIELALIAWALGGSLAAVPYIDSAALAYFVPGQGSVSLCLGGAALEDGRLSGETGSATFAATVDALAVGADTGLALVRRGAAGVTFEPESTLDPSLQPALVRFDRVEAESLADGPDLRSLAALAGVLAAAEAVGAAAAVLELAATYAGQRRQFGHTIGSFQAIRHLLADMYVKVESSWSSVLYAAAALDEREPDAQRTASIAKAHAGRATHDVAHGALQVFGGIAFTAEHPAHRFLRRIAVRREQFGSPREHERSLGRALAQGLEVLT
jgi:alkylation response protein AidB-like acyl-CoA dehydrogenase